MAKCHDFKVQMRFNYSAFTASSANALYARADEVMAYLERQSFPECQNTTLSRKDIRGSLVAFYDLALLITVQFVSSVPAVEATKQRLASCVSVMVQHIQDNPVNISQAVSPFQDAATNKTYPCHSVTYSSNETCCDDTAAKCCPANHVYIHQSSWATSYCCKYGPFFCSRFSHFF